MRSRSIRFEPAAAEMPDRSTLSTFRLSIQPWSLGPMRQLRGMRTSSKKTWLKRCTPTMLMSGLTVTPGVFMSRKK